MAIRKNGIMVRCPECGSMNILVVEVNDHGEIIECLDCGKQFDGKQFEKLTI